MLTTSSFGEGFLSAYLPAMFYTELYCLFYAEREKDSTKLLAHRTTYQQLIQVPAEQTEMSS